MNKKAKKKLKILSVFAIFFAVFVLISADIAYADDIHYRIDVDDEQTPGRGIDPLLDFLGWGVGGLAGLLSGLTTTVMIPLALVVYAAGFIGSSLLQLGAYLVGAALAFNGTILDHGNAVVQLGWTATKELANLGFVLGIIVIAFMTIIRYESYGAKQLLWRLIIAALLVNFSLTIAAVFIDFAGVLSDFFLSSISNQGIMGLPNQLVASFLPQTLLKAQGFGDLAWGAVKTLFSISGSLNFLASIFFVTIFTFLMAIAVLVLAVMFFARFIILSLLLVLVPLAFLFWIFPKFQNLWTKWWDEFLRWVFFAPAALFFLYLAITISVNRADYIKRITDVTTNASAALGGLTDKSVLIDNFFGNAAQMLVVLGFVYAGLILSHKISGHFSGVAMATGGWLSNKLQTVAITRAKRAKGAASLAATRALTAKRAGAPATYAQQFARTLAKVPILRGVGQRLDLASQAVKERIQKQSEELNKQSKEFFQNKVASRKFVPINHEEAAAEYIHAQKMGVKVPERLVASYERAIQATNSSSELLQYAPEFAERFGKNKFEVVLKTPPSRLATRLNEGSLEQQQTIENILNEATAKTDLAPNLRRALDRLQKNPSIQPYFQNQPKLAEEGKSKIIIAKR